MNKTEAIQWIQNHTDSNTLDQDELEAAYVALYQREPADQDRQEGLWSHCCVAVVWFHCCVAVD